METPGGLDQEEEGRWRYQGLHAQSRKRNCTGHLQGRSKREGGRREARISLVLGVGYKARYGVSQRLLTLGSFQSDVLNHRERPIAGAAWRGALIYDAGKICVCWFAISSVTEIDSGHVSRL